MAKAVVGQTYRHYKGGEYTVIALGRHTETLEDLVIYKALDDSLELGQQPVWVRPQAMFEGTVEHEISTVERFTVIK